MQNAITAIETSAQGDERYDRILEEGLNFVYQHTLQTAYTSQRALESYITLIKELFQDDQAFIRFFKTEKALYGALRDEPTMVGRAFIQYAKSKSGI